MARFALDTLVDEDQLYELNASDTVELLEFESYTKDTSLYAVRIAAEDLHDFVDFLDEDEWFDIILEATIID